MDYSVLYCALIDLYDTHHSLIDSAFVKAAVCIGVGLELELDRHLVTVESEMANGSTVCGSEESTRHTVVTGKPQLHTTARIASISGSTIGSTTRLTASTSVAAALRPQQQRRIGLKATKKGPPSRAAETYIAATTATRNYIRLKSICLMGPIPPILYQLVYHHQVFPISSTLVATGALPRNQFA
ncbi:hypothetical protein BSLG_002433 [Batrachochytrium salamandrivorans]|nr:hypothetical protein BSLG_002433 [Batrachochytrium salamandrivorans]